MPTVDRSRTTLQALIIQDSAWGPDCLADDSSYTGLDPLPAQPQPAGTYDMALSSSGTFADPADTLTVTTQQGGIVGRERGASFIWKVAGDANPYYGWDAPTVLTGYETVVWSTSDLKSHPFILALSSGSLLAVWQHGSLQRQIYTSTRTSSWSTPVEITTDSSWALACSPCLLQLPSGKVLLFAWVANSTASTAIVRCLQSDDDGATWTLSSSGCLSEAISLDPTTGYTILQMRVACSQGQILLVVSLEDNRGAPPRATVYELRQYASSDAGASFSLVYQTDTSVSSPHTEEMIYPDLVVANGAFYLSVIDYASDVAVYELSSAYLPLSNVTPASISLSSGPEETLLSSDETGVLFLTTRLTGSGNRWIVYTSTDAGVSWVPMAKSALASSGGVWWDAEDSDTYPSGLHGCWFRGQWLILGPHQSTPSAYDGGSLSLYSLGGYASVTMPGYDPQRTDSLQVTWGQTWLPLDLPGDSGWTRTVTGVPTESLSSGLLVTTVTAAQALEYKAISYGTVTGGIIANWSADWVSGASYRVQIRTANATHGYQLTVTLSSTTLTVLDGKSGTTLATAAVSGEVEVLASITNGIASVWYQQVSAPVTTLRPLARLLSSVALTDDAGATWTQSRLDWALPIGAAASISWRKFFWIDDDNADYVGTGLGAVSLPAGLLGRRYATSAISLDGYTSISAQSGPTFGGQSWSIGVRYENGPDSIFPSVAPSPRQACWLDETVSNSLIFDLHTGTEATGLLGRPLALAILGTNCQGATLYGWDGAAWVTVAQWSSSVTGGAGYMRVGRMALIVSGGTAGYVVRNQCVGWTLVLDGTPRKILANTEGQIGATSSVAAVFELEGVTGSEGTSGTCYLYAAAAVAIVAQPSHYYRFRLTIPAATTPDGYLILGKVILGSIAILGRRLSNGRSLQLVPQNQNSRPPGGPRAWRKLGPSLRRYGLEFGDLLPSSQIWRSSPAPDYLKLSTAGDPLATLHGVALSMMGIAEENQGKYVVYAGNIPQVSSNTATTNLLLPQQIIYGQIVEPGSLEIVRGNEGNNETYRYTGMVLEDEP